MPRSLHRKNKRRIFIGIDPGIHSVGYGVIGERNGRVSLLDAGLLAPPERNRRYRAVARALRNLIATWRPEAIGIEKIIFSKNARTAIAVAEMIGVLKLVTEDEGIAIREISPSAVKLAVAGSGNAPKQLIGKMVAAMLKLDAPPTPHHAADALAVALTAERHARFGIIEG
jgi:crossover junction endodeoxyribonuclease RuvC